MRQLASVTSEVQLDVEIALDANTGLWHVEVPVKLVKNATQG